ncbi:MAG TPA: trypsin-like peptidase domain-containing protein [Candidatus Dojkabacteria bacterium]|nr:trypsin-like peptidase domain-containing protein [Candidatus Dojkabacteria bacterium]
MEKNISKIPTLIEDEKSSGGKDIKVLNKQGKKKRKGVVKFFLAVFLLSLLIPLLIACLIYFLLFDKTSFLSKYLKATEVGNNDDKIELVVTEDEANTINIVKQTQESVVSIAISQITLKQGEGLTDLTNNIGTGFIVDDSGIVVTNQHVVSDTTSSYKVVSYLGDEFEVTKILRDDVSDIALLRIDKKDKELKSLKLGDSDKLLVGQNVIAIGTPLGEYAGSVTSGIISGLNRSVSAGTGWFGTTTKTYEGVIQTDAAINPGNSGGPLINSQGEVIGVNFATTSGVDNISFALPINKVKNRLEEYKTHGKFIRPYLGVSYQMISEYEALYYKDVVPGALVVRIDPVSPAYEAGIRRGDFITEFGGEKTINSLGELIQKHKVGEEVEVKVWRAGVEQSFKVKLGEMD